MAERSDGRELLPLVLDLGRNYRDRLAVPDDHGTVVSGRHRKWGVA